MSIRILDPADPNSPYLSQCVEVAIGVAADMCALRSVDLLQKPIPVRDLEVQVALFPESMIMFDMTTGDPICPANTEYDAAYGFPIASGETPAVGGRAFYHPGAETVDVTLGCTNLDAINGCTGEGAVKVSGQVNDFLSGVGVIDELTVAVGEPVPSTPSHVLPPMRLTPLRRMNLQWSGEVDDPFKDFACLAVLDDAPQSTTSLVCRRADAADKEIRFTSINDNQDPDFAGAGVRLSKAALDEILLALGTPFPMAGLTVGIVRDSNGNPVSNQTVSTSAGTVQYLSADRLSFTGTRTGSSGIWISTDAALGTTFTAQPTTGTPISRIGGQVENKATIVVLQFTSGVGG